MARPVAKQSSGLRAHAVGKRPKFNGRLHAHGCTTCGRRYEDNCDTSRQDSECFYCISGRTEYPVWVQNALPRACCVEQAILVLDYEFYERYRLAGQVEWWYCPACARTHPYKPMEAAQ